MITSASTETIWYPMSCKSVLEQSPSVFTAMQSELWPLGLSRELSVHFVHSTDPTRSDNYTDIVPTEWRTGVDPFDTYALPTPGPLMTSALA